MSECYLSEIGIFGFNFAPRNWAICDGQLIAINENPSLYSLLGTQFGGNGMTSFGLPQLQGRVAVGNNSQYGIGQSGGSQYVTLSEAEIPQHTHAFFASSQTGYLVGNRFGDNQLAVEAQPDTPTYASAVDLVSMAPETISNAGDTQQHYNMQPYITMLFCIALQGFYPDRN